MDSLTGDDFARIIYLGLFLSVIAGWFLLSQRQRIGKVIQQAAIWLFIFFGTILAYGIWDDIRDTVLPRQSVAVDGSQVRVPQHTDGHFYLTLEVNGTPIRFVVDTGATDMVLRAEDAEKAGIDIEALVYSNRAMTANGVIETAPVRLDEVTLGPVTDSGVRAVVNPGDMHESLLGMGYLGRFESIEITRGELILTR